MKWLLRTKILALICLSAFLVSLTYVTLQVPKLFTELRVSTIAEIHQTSEKLDNRLESIEITTNNRLQSMERGLLGESKAIRVLADNHLTSMETKVDNQITRTNDNVEKLLAAYAALPDEFKTEYETNFKPYIDCQNNGLCLQNNVLDTSIAVRAAARQSTSTLLTVKNEVPKITVNMSKISSDIALVSNTFATDVPKITNNVNQVAYNINRLTTPKWYDRVLGYALNGAIMYRSFNPATNLTVKGVQLLQAK